MSSAPKKKSAQERFRTCTLAVDSSNVECSICLSGQVDPHVICGRGHTCCFDCVVGMRKAMQDRCPKCRRQLVIVRAPSEYGRITEKVSAAFQERVRKKTLSDVRYKMKKRVKKEAGAQPTDENASASDIMVERVASAMLRSFVKTNTLGKWLYDSEYQFGHSEAFREYCDIVKDDERTRHLVEVRGSRVRAQHGV